MCLYHMMYMHICVESCTICSCGSWLQKWSCLKRYLAIKYTVFPLHLFSFDVYDRWILLSKCTSMEVIVGFMLKIHSITYYEKYFFKLRSSLLIDLNWCKFLVSVTAESTATASQITLFSINGMLFNYFWTCIKHLDV